MQTCEEVAIGIVRVSPTMRPSHKEDCGERMTIATFFHKLLLLPLSELEMEGGGWRGTGNVEELEIHNNTNEVLGQ